jgi:copper transport protein
VTVRDRLFTLTADVVPARAGLNDVHLYATSPDEQLADIKEWVVKAELPSAGIEPIEASVLVLTPDHATGQIALPEPGVWRFSFTLRTSEIDQSTATGDVVIRP